MDFAGTHVMRSLELLGETGEDPTGPIYQRLFEGSPELEPLFILDTDQSVRGSMLQNALECIFDFCDGNRMATNFVETSRFVHDGYGVPDEKFDEFFIAIRDCCRISLDGQWTDDMDKEWQAMLTAFANKA
ncbi:MAG: globin [Alphaproteobacteria bacterium]|nr:MAG: globin [Alphaproteobacteria bacterium]